jgi:hypothetical protein
VSCRLDAAGDGFGSNVSIMSGRTRFFLIAMSVCFGAATLGLVIGLLYDLYVVGIRHRSLETVLGHSIRYNELLGGFGILGLLFFFAFLFSAIADKRVERHR